MEPAIHFRNVYAGYTVNHILLNDMSFTIPYGSFYYLTGISGSGKTSLIKLIYGGLQAISGLIQVLNYPVNTLNHHEILQLRQQIGVVFQNFNLIEDLSVVENVALPLRIRGNSWRYSINRAKEILNWIGFEQSFDLLPKNLSGGQKQCVVTSRAIINEPKLILADEATGNLDDSHAVRLVEIFRALNQRGTTILFATHNHGLIHLFPYPQIIIEQGSIVVRSHNDHNKIPVGHFNNAR